MNFPPHFPLADSDSVSTAAVLGWSLVLIFLVVGGFLGISLFRKWLARDEETTPKVAFTLGDFRQMLKEGQISEEEFEKAKAQLIAATQRAAAQAAEAKEGKPPGTDVEAIRRRVQQNRTATEPPPPPVE